MLMLGDLTNRQSGLVQCLFCSDNRDKKSNLGLQKLSQTSHFEETIA